MKEKKYIGIALIGCGGMAANYRHRYTEIPGAKLLLVVDINEKVAQETAMQLKVEKWSTDFNDCLIPEIDIVDISTPNFLHAEQATAALHAKKHILLQKPIAPSVREAELIVNSALESGMTAGMYMSLFDNPLYYDVKKLIDYGRLGVISSIHCRCAHRGGLRMQQGNWRQSLEKTGGGSFIQLAVHNMNMVQWLLSERIISVMAFSKNMMCPNVGGDDITVVACEFNNGVLGTLESSYCADSDMLSIYGTKGFINIIDNHNVELCLDETFEGEIIQYATPAKLCNCKYDFDTFSLYKGINPFDQHITFVKAVQAGNPPQVTVETGLYDLKIVQAVYKSATEKSMVKIL